MDCSLPGSSIHGIFQAIVLERIAISFSRGSSQPRDGTRVSCIVDKTLYHLSHQEVPREAHKDINECVLVLVTQSFTCPASSVRAREGAGCGSVGAVSGA